ncbi:MAG TPA: STAS domain-containing protein, partial [Pseudonocardiaceae bacterium]|nr:STAS domain-containing protein [Pseudonocardiaceae bacterium]
MDSSGDPLESVTITQTTQSDALILHLDGELDLPTAAATRTALLHATNALPPPWRVVLDLSAVRFLSAAG